VEADLKRLGRLAFRRAEHCGPLVRRFEWRRGSIG
jgi:hypothetical protein